jgi:hypothetical protein
MKRAWKFMLMLPIAGASALIAACATTSGCNNDACYDRNISSVDPYRKGDVAAWGTEKQVADQEEEQDNRTHHHSTPVMRKYDR